MEGDDPIARLWVHAMRAELDAVTLRFEAQLKQHVAATAGARREELDALAQQLAAANVRVAESEQRAGELSARLTERDAEIARMRALHDEAAREIAALHAELDEARRTLGEMGARVTSLDAQFASERAFVGAVTGVAGTLLFEVSAQVFGQALEATPTCYGAIKARKADVLLAAIVRERGRSVTRYALSREEREALGALAEASGCALIEVAPGARFASASMEKVATRSEPADEDHVLACLMPGVRLAESQGAVVHPKVVVATA